jgi:hypothetical protein
MNPGTLFSTEAKLPFGAHCANCQNADKLVLMPLCDAHKTPAIALIFLCGVCKLAAKEGVLVADLKLRFLGM